MNKGAISGHEMQDVKVTVYDGKHHAVDSKEIAFVQAGKKAFLDAVNEAKPIVMEPIVDVNVHYGLAKKNGIVAEPDEVEKRPWMDVLVAEPAAAIHLVSSCGAENTSRDPG